MEQALLDQEFFGLTILDWGQLLLVWVVAAAVLLTVKWFIAGRLSAIARRTHNNIDDMVAVLFKRTRRFFLVLIALSFAVSFMTDDAPAVSVIRRIVFLAALVQTGLWGNALVVFWSDWYIERQGDEGQAQITAIRAVGVVARIVVWSILFVLALDNFGIDITALVAGLGIGGIAIALAVQNVLQDLLAYISIVVDKPFVYGDFVVLGEYAGSVEHIGIKSTRLRSLSGEQLVMSNSDLLSSRLRNFKRMYERRVAFSTGVTYDTPREQLERVPSIIKQAIQVHDDLRFDRSHLKAFDDFAVTFESVYFVTVPDYALFMDRQQAINLAIHKAFEDAGIEFAFPTQTIHLVSDSNAPTQVKASARA